MKKMIILLFAAAVLTGCGPSAQQETVPVQEEVSDELPMPPME